MRTAQNLFVPADAPDTFAASTLLRSGFDGFRYGLLDDPEPTARHTFDERIAVSQFLTDHYTMSDSRTPLS